MKSSRRILKRVYIQPETYYHLSKLAAAAGLKYPGQAADKLVRNYREQMNLNKNL